MSEIKTDEIDWCLEDRPSKPVLPSIRSEAREQLSSLKARIAELESQLKDAERRILEEYTKFLCDYSYTDSDVWCEHPTAIERFMSEREEAKAREGKE